MRRGAALCKGDPLMVRATPQQRLAIQYLEGPLCISAGAGSGKTWVLSERFVRAASVGVAGRPVDVTEALAITFTEKAAGELAERVRGALAGAGLTEASRRVDEAWISTIHGLCSRILRRNALQIGLDPGFRVIADVEAAVLRQQCLVEVLERSVKDDAEVRDLVSCYGWEPVGKDVLAAHARLSGLGVATDETASPLRRAIPGEIGALIPSVLADLRASREALVGCGSKGANFDTCAVSIDSAISDVVRLGAEIRDAPGEGAQALWSLLRAVRLPKPAGEGRVLIEGLAAALGSARERLLEMTLAPRAESFRGLVTRFAEAYGSAKADRGVLDYADLQLMTADALQRPGGIGEELAGAFRLVMVDEFQDTDALQARIVDHLGGGLLCTVGDDKQSIYGFRDADVGVFRDHVERMRRQGAGSAVLARNFRSHADVLGAVNSIFSAEAVFGSEFVPLEHGRDESRALAWPIGLARLSAVLVDERMGTVDVTAATEAEALAGRIRTMVDEGVDEAGIVVLMRSLKAMGPYADALKSRGFRVAVAGGGDFFGRPEVEWFLSLLRVLSNVRDDEALASLLACPLAGVSCDTLLRARLLAEQDAPTPMWDVLVAAATGRADAAIIERLTTAVTKARSRCGSGRLSAALLGACEDMDADLRMLEAGLEGEGAFANLLKLARMADAFEAQGGSGLPGLLDHLRLKATLGDPEPPAVVADESTPAIRFMTIHAAKGLEFPVVALAALGRKGSGAQGHLHVDRIGNEVAFLASLPPGCGGDAASRRPPVVRACLADRADKDAQEAKRVFYVGCTRAREALLLTASARFDKPGAGPAQWLRDALGQAECVRPGRYDVDLGNELRVHVEALDQPGEPRAPAEAHASPEGRVLCEEPERVASVGSSTPPARTGASAAILNVPEELSFSRLADAQDCRLGFFLRTMARVGTPAQAQGDPRAFGDAVHAALYLAHDRTLPSVDRLDSIARTHGLDEEGRVRLERAVATFAGSGPAARAASADTVRREVPFAVPIPGSLPHTLIGSIDLLARTRGAPTLVVDYKTGRAGGDSESRRRRLRLQAMCYALPLLRVEPSDVDVAFVLLETPDAEGEPAIVTESFGARDAEGLAKEIGAIVEALESGPYVPKRRWTPSCRSCPGYGALCPVRGPSLR